MSIMLTVLVFSCGFANYSLFPPPPPPPSFHPVIQETQYISTVYSYIVVMGIFSLDIVHRLSKKSKTFHRVDVCPSVGNRAALKSVSLKDSPGWTRVFRFKPARQFVGRRHSVVGCALRMEDVISKTFGNSLIKKFPRYLSVQFTDQLTDILATFSLSVYIAKPSHRPHYSLVSTRWGYLPYLKSINGLIEITFSWAPHFKAWECGVAISIPRYFSLRSIFMGLPES
jgi:hypothetical protein